MNLPKVSVVTITYGHEKFVIETIKGVLSQQYDGEIEFIIANDNSPDGTDNVILEFLKHNHIPKNFEIKYSKHDSNLGMLKNFLWALKQVTGEYIAFCEGDDYWIDNLKLHKQVDFLEKNDDYVLSNTDCNILYQSLGLYKKNINKRSRKNFREVNFKVNYEDVLDAKYIIRTASVVVKSSYVNQFLDTNFYTKFSKLLMMADTPLWTFLSTKGKFHYIEYPTAIYRVSSVGVSNSVDDVQKLKFSKSICEMKFIFVENNSYQFSKKFLLKNKLVYNYLHTLTLSKGIDIHFNYRKYLSVKKNVFVSKFFFVNILNKIFFRILLKIYNSI